VTNALLIEFGCTTEVDVPEANITIIQNKADLDLKGMIQGLKKSASPDNPYFDRSESQIAKMILGPALQREFAKYCNKTKAKTRRS
jgi:hypothetical protein